MPAKYVDFWQLSGVSAILAEAELREDFDEKQPFRQKSIKHCRGREGNFRFGWGARSDGRLAICIFVLTLNNAPEIRSGKKWNQSA